jgi:hypothetical protein
LALDVKKAAADDAGANFSAAKLENMHQLSIVVHHNVRIVRDQDQLPLLFVVSNLLN